MNEQTTTGQNENTAFHTWRKEEDRVQRECEDVALTTRMDGVGTMAERGVATSGT